MLNRHPAAATRAETVSRKLIRDVAVREHNFVHRILRDDVFKIGFAVNRNPGRIMCSGQFWWIATLFDVRDLGGGESDNLIQSIVSVAGVEHVKVTSPGTHDQDFVFENR